MLTWRCLVCPLWQGWICPSFRLADAPKTATLSVSPSAEVAEGSPVTLNCSSDANPATYIWYKDNQTFSEGAQSIYDISRITVKDGGSYHCQCVNQHGAKTSTRVHVNVQCEWRTAFILCSVPMNYPSINPSAILWSIQSIRLSDLECRRCIIRRWMDTVWRRFATNMCSLMFSSRCSEASNCVISLLWCGGGGGQLIDNKLYQWC